MFSSLIFVFIFPLLISASFEEKNFVSSSLEKYVKYCLLPPYPEHGKYTVSNYPSAMPGDSYPSVKLNISCDIGYLNDNDTNNIICVNGFWSATMPRCVSDSACGLITQHRKLEGSSTNHVELPWHAVIYNKTPLLYVQLCSGSLVTANKIISSARCFSDYNNKLLPASYFFVAVDKMYPSKNSPRDGNSQWSDIVDIKIPSGYQGKPTNFEDDIAIVIVERPFIFRLSVRPVCLDFDMNLDSTQLTEGNSGKEAHWTYDDNNGNWRVVLNEVDFTYINFEECHNMLDTKYRQYLTNDKFCAIRNGTKVLRRYVFGAGLAFFDPTTQRYYLRGVFTGPLFSENHYIFTSIVKHEHFIKQHL